VPIGLNMAHRINKEEIVHEMQESLGRIDNRVHHLENVSKDLNMGMANRDKKWQNVKDTFRSDIKALKEDIKEIRKTISNYEKSLLILSKEFKTLITKEDIEKLQARIDEWPLEFFVQKDMEEKEPD
jgi:hypothetical protein